MFEVTKLQLIFCIIVGGWSSQAHLPLGLVAGHAAHGGRNIPTHGLLGQQDSGEKNVKNNIT